jgi:hypothetical protein
MSIGIRSPSTQLAQVKGDLQAAERGLKLGMREFLGRFDTAASAHMFQSFTLQLSLFGADAGARFLDEHRPQLAAMPEHLRAMFTGLMGDAREVDALRGEVKRLTGLQSVERLLSTMQAT